MSACMCLCRCLPLIWDLCRVLKISFRNANCPPKLTKTSSIVLHSELLSPSAPCHLEGYCVLNTATNTTFSYTLQKPRLIWGNLKDLFPKFSLLIRVAEKQPASVHKQQRINRGVESCWSVALLLGIRKTCKKKKVFTIASICKYYENSFFFFNKLTYVNYSVQHRLYPSHAFNYPLLSAFAFFEVFA